jgi:hypothetical protein
MGDAARTACHIDVLVEGLAAGRLGLFDWIGPEKSASQPESEEIDSRSQARLNGVAGATDAARA